MSVRWKVKNFTSSYRKSNQKNLRNPFCPQWLLSQFCEVKRFLIMEPALVSDWPISRASEYDHSPKQMNSLGSKHFFLCACGRVTMPGVWGAKCSFSFCFLRVRFVLFPWTSAVRKKAAQFRKILYQAITTLVHWTECAKWLILYYKDRIFWKRKSKKIVNCLVHSPVLKVRSSATLDLPNSFQLTFCGLFQIFKISNCCSNLSGWSLTLD